MNRILAIIVSYKPDEELLKRNVNALLPEVDHLIIWENMPESESLPYRYFNDEKITYCGEGHNVGISKALNYAWHYAANNGYSYLLTMDQDSIWQNLHEFKHVIFKSSLCKSAIFAPTHHDNIIRQPFCELDYCITSGALVPIDVLNTIGGYNESFFVDGIDVELGYRAQKFGFKTLAVADCNLIHRPGMPSKVSFCGFKFMTKNYSPTRLYGITRNFTILHRLYPEKKYVSYQLYHIFLWKYSVRILFGESKKKEKLIAIFKGYIDGLTYGKMKFKKYWSNPLYKV